VALLAATISYLRTTLLTFFKGFFDTQTITNHPCTNNSTAPCPHILHHINYRCQSPRAQTNAPPFSTHHALNNTTTTAPRYQRTTTAPQQRQKKCPNQYQYILYFFKNLVYLYSPRAQKPPTQPTTQKKSHKAKP
jgi:hypothetical protein